MSDVRTRFAPSPTGYLHVGGVRTALFAWLVAKQAGGQFLVRIEDTDKSREVAESGAHILRVLKALDLNYDEGPDQEGDFGPYTQSERLDIYQEWANKLIDRNRAYVDPYSPEEVQQFRDQAAKNHQPFLYRNHRPDANLVWDGTRPLRFRSEPKSYHWHDAVMGDLSAGAEAIDDFILIKSDGYPTYNFAHIVDDYLMKISHVIRGQEFVASVPNYLNLYEALEIKPPILATPPPVLGPTGNKKLSKRDGAKDILDYLKEGYLEDALINFMASLGWNDGTTQEIYSRQELIERFSLERIQKSGARFDEQRLLWMNGSHIRGLSIEELAAKCNHYWPAEADGYDSDYLKSVLSLIQERLKLLSELPELSRFFFIDLPLDPNLIASNKKLSKFTNQDLIGLLAKVEQSLAESDFSLDDLTIRLNKLLEETEQSPAVLFSLIRIATTQAPSSPPLAETMALLGKDRCLKRIRLQLDSLRMLK